MPVRVGAMTSQGDADRDDHRDWDRPAERSPRRDPGDPRDASVGDGVFDTSRFRDNLRLFVPPARLLELLEVLKERVRLRAAGRAGRRPTTSAIPGRTRARFEVHYVLLNLETAERLVVKAGVDDPDPTLPIGRRPLAGGRLDGARGLRHVRHPLQRAIPTCGGS